MAAQVSDGLLYSFTPGGRTGSSPSAAPGSPLMSPRRLRTPSGAGDGCGNFEDTTDALQLSPRSTSILNLPGRPPGMGVGFGGGPERPATSGSAADRVNSAGRQSMSGLPTSSTSTSMPSLPQGGGGSMRMRHSIAGSGGVGLPKLELPPAMGGPGGGPGGGGGMRRQSVPGSGLGSELLSSSMDLPPFPGAAADGATGVPQAGLSPRTLSPLAPLRPSTAQTPLGAGPFAGPSGAAGATAAFLEASSDAPLGAAARRRCSANGGIMEAGSMPLLAAADNDTLSALPLPTAVSHGGTSPLSPRRSHSLSMVGDSIGSGGLGGGGVLDHATASTAATLLSEVNDDLQRAAGALQALHTPACRPRSAASPGSAAAAAAAAAAEMTTAQLGALSSSAPELHMELRSSLRRAFQVMRQELGGAGGGGGSGGGSAGARQLSGCVHECWATLDAFLEGTAELTNMLVNGLLEARSSAASSGSAGGGGGKQPNRSASRVAESERLADAQDEAEGLREANSGMRRQLEEMRGRLAEAEVLAEAAESRAATAEARAAAMEAELAGGGSGGGAGGSSAGPRPPGGAMGAGPMASPPTSERSVGVSPRRGLHARDRRPDSASSNGSAGPAGGSGGGADGPSPAPPQKLFDRVGTAQRGQHRAEVVIEEEDGEEEEWAVSPTSPEGRRRMLTMHTASFAEWVRDPNNRRPPGHPGHGR
ncbi:hypothetical protein HXX76_013356 [Chlamydomonas incerta]|uniref:Uncharacterized protein n=1 Tax=Chlamydomonas incerta TaxID=51695 RepID=A0A835SSJ4_CHLIN|nr:hypothetical protein HXX76_013356 [Chlamydomonas incerta]|eukprot:KAG2425985.1 hypothetical protein HXX76_013356 [Chlamydomonas incerta]